MQIRLKPLLVSSWNNCKIPALHPGLQGWGTQLSHLPLPHFRTQHSSPLSQFPAALAHLWLLPGILSPTSLYHWLLCILQIQGALITMLPHPVHSTNLHRAFWNSLINHETMLCTVRVPGPSQCLTHRSHPINMSKMNKWTGISHDYVHGKGKKRRKMCSNV